MATVTRSPTLSIKNKSIRLTFQAENAAASAIRAWVTAAPPGSKEHEALHNDSASRLEVEMSDLSDSFQHEFTPSVAGAYVFKAQEYAESSFLGAYENDPAAYSQQVPVGNETELKIYVAERLVMPLRIEDVNAELVLYVSNATILQTDLSVAPEVTPLIRPLDTNARTRMAIADSNVQTALAALGGTAASASLGDHSAILDSLIDELNDHFVEAGVHAADDTDNTIDESFKGARNRKDFAESLGALLQALDRHIRNDNAGSGTGSAATDYHSAGDWDNRPLFPGQVPEDPGQQTIMLADAWRAYEAHRTSAVHSASDTTNAATAISGLLSLLRYWCIILRLSEPTAPPTANPGAVALISGAGFEERDL